MKSFLKFNLNAAKIKKMTDPILYLSILLGLGGVYVLISSFHNDDGDDGERYFYNLKYTNLAK